MIDLKSIVKRNYVFALVILFFFLLLVGYYITSGRLDPDFGWHLKTGQLILERGIPKTDWYSYSMPNFPWIDHEWLTDVFINKMYSFFGFGAVLLTFLSIYILAFIIPVKKKIFHCFLLPIILGFFATFGFIGIRPQLLTVFFIAVLAFALNKFFENPQSKLIYFCPLLFILWANIHGGFLAGLFLLLLFLVLEIFKKTQLFRIMISWKIFAGQIYRNGQIGRIKVLAILFFSSVIATFINPYGPRLYREVFSSVGDSFLRAHIAEWAPLFSTGSFSSVFLIFLYLIFFISLLVLFYKKIEFNNIVLALLFGLFAFSSQRNILIFIVLTIPIFAELIFYLRSEVGYEKFKRVFGGRKKWVVISVSLGLLAYGFYSYVDAEVNPKSSDAYPSKTAISFLKTLPLSENLLNEYNWGGYLIWQLPERKYFIDGRMPSWRENGQFAFGDYVKIMDNQSDAKQLLEKYNIKIVLLNAAKKDEALAYTKFESSPKNSVLTFFQKYSWLSKTLGISFPSDNIYNGLVNSGWKNVYEDKTDIIFEKI